MKNKVDNVLRYIINNYPYPDELSKTRTTKLIYLVDWKSVQKTGHQITEIEWYFDHYGPYVSDVFDTADEDSEIRISEKVSNFGTKKYIVESKLSKEKLRCELSSEESDIIDEVIDETKFLSWNAFIDFVYATPPIVQSEKYGFLDLKKLANS